jgi:hypothetical protein
MPILLYPVNIIESTSREFTVKTVNKNNKLVSRAVVVVSAALIMATPALPIVNNGIGHADTAGSYTTLSSFSGHPNVMLTVSGGNYAHNEVVTIIATQNGVTVASTTATANQYGEFTSALQLPVKLSQGAVVITATGTTSGLLSSNSYYAAPFTPSLTANKPNHPVQ